jgi:hypothetical protein
MTMTLKDGKFWQDGKVVPLEHGNKDQINLIEKVNVLRTEGSIGPLVFDEKKNSIVGMQITCVCGSIVSVVFQKEEDRNNTKIKCSGCNLSYLFMCVDVDFPFFKLLK